MEDIAGEVLPAYIENARQKDLISIGCRNGVSGRNDSKSSEVYGYRT